MLKAYSFMGLPLYSSSAAYNFFYLVSNSSAAALAPGALPLQLLGPNYGTGDTNTVSKSIIYEQFTECLTG